MNVVKFKRIKRGAIYHDEFSQSQLVQGRFGTDRGDRGGQMLGHLGGTERSESLVQRIN